MAETLGVIAASYEIGKVVWQCKQLCESIKAAPNQITTLLDDVEDATTLLQEIEQQSFMQPSMLPKAIWINCLTRCQRATRDLRATAQQLHNDIRKAKIKGSFKAIFKEDTILAQTRRLESIKSSLTMALVVGLSTIQIQQGAEHRAMLVSTTHLITDNMFASNQSGFLQNSPVQPQPGSTIHRATKDPNHSGNQVEVTHRSVYATTIQKRSQPTVRCHFAMPWMMNKVFELQMWLCTQDFGMNFRQHNYRPYNTLVFKYARQGNIKELQALLASGQASVHDKIAEADSMPEDVKPGSTALQVAVQWGQVDTARFLIRQGADFNARNDDGQTCLDSLVFSYRAKGESYLDLTRLLVVDCAVDDLADSSKPQLCWNFACNQDAETSTEAVKLLTQHIWPPYHLQDRKERILRACRSHYQSSNLFWTLLADDTLDCDDLQPVGSFPLSISEQIISILATLQAQVQYGEDDYSEKSQNELLQDWREMFKKVVTLGGLKVEHANGRSTVQIFLKNFLRIRMDVSRRNCSSIANTNHAANLGLKLWIQELMNAGVSGCALEQYGKAEQRLISSHEQDIEPPLLSYHGYYYEYHTECSISDLMYGDNASKWSITISLPWEYYFLEFLDGIDARVGKNEFEEFDLPGAWKEEDDWPILENPFRLHLIQEFMVSSKRKRLRGLRYMQMYPQQETKLFGPDWRVIVNSRARLRSRVNFGDPIPPDGAEDGSNLSMEYVSLGKQGWQYKYHEERN